MSTAGSLKQQPNGTWSFVTNVVPGPVGARRQARKRGFATKKEAQEALDELRTGVRKGTYVPASHQSLSAYLDGWLEGLPTSGLRPSTIDGTAGTCSTCGLLSAAVGSTSSRPGTLTVSTANS